MTMNQPRLRKLRYQITPEDYAALRACLSARAEERETRSVFHQLPGPCPGRFHGRNLSPGAGGGKVFPSLLR